LSTPAVFLCRRRPSAALFFAPLTQETAMNLTLAIVSQSSPSDCALQLLDRPGELHAGYGPAVRGRIRIVPGQLVAVDMAADRPSVMWRWFRGVVILRRDDHVVVDNHVFQPGFRIPISVARLPDILEVDVRVGDEVFYGAEPYCAVIDVARDGRPAHPARIAADLFPAIADVYAERAERGEA